MISLSGYFLQNNTSPQWDPIVAGRSQATTSHFFVPNTLIIRLCRYAIAWSSIPIHAYESWLSPITLLSTMRWWSETNQISAVRGSSSALSFGHFWSVARLERSDWLHGAGRPPTRVCARASALYLHDGSACVHSNNCDRRSKICPFYSPTSILKGRLDMSTLFEKMNAYTGINTLLFTWMQKVVWYGMRRNCCLA